MNNLELTSVLEVAVFGMAIAQALTILLTVRRERDVKDLRELVEEQRLRLIELRAWLAGRNALQTRRIASEREAGPQSANADTPASAPPMQNDQARVAEDAAVRAVKELEWQRDVTARLKASINADVSPTKQASAPTDTFKWFKGDDDEPKEMAEARETVASLRAGSGERLNHSAEGEPQPNAAQDELGRVTRAVNQLKEDVEKGSLMSRLTKPSVAR